MYKSRIERLERKHRELHQRIDNLEKQFHEDAQLTTLKREKLAIKDEISRLQRLQFEHDHDYIDWDDER